MAQREGTVYLWLFIVAMVLFVGMTVAWVMKNNEVKEMASKVSDAKGKEKEAREIAVKIRDQRQKLAALVVGNNKADSYEGDTDALVDDVRSKNLTRARTDINEALTDLTREKAPEFKSLVEPYDFYKDIFEAYKIARNEAVQNSNKSADELAKTLESEKQVAADLRQKLAEAKSEVAEAQQAQEDCQGEKDAALARMTSEIEEKEEEFTDKELEHNRAMQRLRNEIATLSVLVQQLQAKDRKSKTLADALPDGRLINVSSQLGKAWIDRGRKNRMRAGLIFRVYQEIKGGKKLYKGRVEVRKVHEDYSEVALLDQVDPDRRPMTAGDRITSPFYAEDEKPILVFAGVQLQSQDMTQDFVRAKLRGYGVEISTTVDTKTSFLVALKDYDKTQEYRVADKLGIPILREQELMDFIGY